MKPLLFLFLLLSVKCFSQNVTVRFDTLDFAYKSGPYLVNYSNLFNELPFENHLGMDQTYYISILISGLIWMSLILNTFSMKTNMGIPFSTLKI